MDKQKWFEFDERESLDDTEEVSPDSVVDNEETESDDILIDKEDIEKFNKAIGVKKIVDTATPVDEVKIKQLALNNQLVRTYTSVEEASNHTGISQECLIDACDGVGNHIYAGFKWMYI